MINLLYCCCIEKKKKVAFDTISKKRLAPYLRGQKIDKSLFLAEKFCNYKGI